MTRTSSRMLRIVFAALVGMLAVQMIIGGLRGRI